MTDLSPGKRKTVDSPLSASKIDATFAMWAELARQTSIEIQGNSMSPFIKDGETLVIHHGQEQFSPGDILVFRQADCLIAHRLIRCWKEDGKITYLTKGDANRTVDPPLEYSQIMGRVTAIHRSTMEVNLEKAFWRGFGALVVTSTNFLGLEEKTHGKVAGKRRPMQAWLGKLYRFALRTGRRLFVLAIMQIGRLLPKQFR